MKSRLTPIKPRNFAETGAASRFKQRIEDQSRGVTDLPGVNSIVDLTPFQGQVLDNAALKEKEEREKEREEARSQNSGQSRPRNSRAGGGGSDMGSRETVRYINKEQNPDHEVHN